MRPKLTEYSFALVLATLPVLAVAQTFPSKPIRMIVGFPPGGGTDIVARIIAPKLGGNIGQQIIVDNRGGANGIVGTDLAAKAAPDGYTLFLGTAGNLAVNPMLYKTLPFDVSRDFAPVTQVADATLIMIVHPSFPAKSVKELVSIAKARRGQINYSTSGTGSLLHLGAELLNGAVNIKMNHIPYKGSAPSLTAVISGEVDACVDTVLLSLQYVKAGRVRAIAVLGKKRSPLLPNVPTMAESIPGYEVTNWFGLVIPAATPPETRARISAEVIKVLRSPDTKERLLNQGAEAIGSTSEEFGAFLKAETAKWAKVIREAKIQME